jgi:hypothetical protein
VLVQRGIERLGIVAIVAGHAKGASGKAGGGDQAVLRKIVEGISVQVFADFLEGMVGGHELAAVGKINAIDAGVHVGRATDEHMDFGGAGFLEIVDAGFAGGAAHDGIIHYDDALALHQLSNEVEFHADVEVADELRGLQEAAAHVVVADEGHLERNAGLEGIAEGGAVAAVRHRDDDVGLNGKFAGEMAAHVHADFIDVAVGDVAIRAGEIDVLENTKGAALMLGKGLDALQAVLVDDDDLAGLNVTNKFGVDEVECASFAAKDVGIAEFADAKGTETKRIARANQFLFRHQDEGIGAFQHAHGVDKRIFAAVGVGLGEQVQDDLAVHGGLENGAPGFELIAQAGGVGQVAVVGDGDLATRAVHGEGLGVFQLRGAGGGIAGVADGKVADELMQNVAVKNLGDEAHAAMGAKLAAVTGDNAGAFLAAVLQGIKAVISKFGGIGMTKNAEDTTVMFGIDLHRAYAEFSQKKWRSATGKRKLKGKDLGNWLWLFYERAEDGTPNNSPSPRPSPAGRGRIIRQLFETTNDNRDSFCFAPTRQRQHFTKLEDSNLLATQDSCLSFYGFDALNGLSPFGSVVSDFGKLICREFLSVRKIAVTKIIAKPVMAIKAIVLKLINITKAFVVPKRAYWLREFQTNKSHTPRWKIWIDFVILNKI